MVVYASAQIISAPAQLITAPAQPPATGAVVYTALFLEYPSPFLTFRYHLSPANETDLQSPQDARLLTAQNRTESFRRQYHSFDETWRRGGGGGGGAGPTNGRSGGGRYVQKQRTLFSVLTS